MIFSIGYQRLTPELLETRMLQLGVSRILDVRSVAVSRVRGFGGRQLAAQLGEMYQHRPDLGGRTVIDPQALDTLARRREHLMLLCMEEAPGDCHRHHTIAVPLLDRGVDIRHVYRGEVVLASELARALVDDSDYVVERHL